LHSSVGDLIFVLNKKIIFLRKLDRSIQLINLIYWHLVRCLRIRIGTLVTSQRRQSRNQKVFGMAIKHTMTL